MISPAVLRRRQTAFSLMEIVVSLAILGLVIALVLNVFPSSVMASYSASEQMEAENLAQSFIEETRATGFSSLTVGTSILISPSPRFQVQREIFVPTGADADQTIGVRVTITWESKKKQRELIREIWLSSVRS